MVVVQCWRCGEPFELLDVSWCGGHREHEEPDPRSDMILAECKKCPNCNAALHDKVGFDLLPRREPTMREAIMGFVWVLANVPEDD